MEEYDRCQLGNVANQFEAYETGKMDLSALISSLEALLNCLQKPSGSWLDQFREQWAILEEVYSVAVVREQPIESPDNRKLVDAAINQMRQLISGALNNEQ